MKKYYKIIYACGLFEDRAKQNTRFIGSSVELKKDDFVLIENANKGIFIGKVFEEVCKKEIFPNDVDNYNYVQHIDLSDYLKKVENAKRKEELKKQMEERFAVIDKEKKYQYYAELDADFKAMFEEYKKL